MPIAPDDVCRNKAAIIERSLRRMKEEYTADPELENYTHIDAMILNVERACQGAIDLAMHIVARDHLGMPQNSAEAFQCLLRMQIISEITARDMVAMTGFRNIAIHEYQQMDMSVLKNIAEKRWQSFVIFCTELGLRIVP